MNRIKRLVCFIISLCIITGLAVSQSAPAEASAKQASIKKLALSDLDKNADWIVTLGNDLYMVGNDVVGYRNVYRITTNKGKIKTEPVNLESKIFQLPCNIYNNRSFVYNGNYAIFAEEDDEQYYATVIAVVKYDAATNTISDVLYTEEPKNDYAVNSSGQVMIYDRKERAFIIYDKKGYQTNKIYLPNTECVTSLPWQGESVGYYLTYGQGDAILTAVDWYGSETQVAHDLYVAAGSGRYNYDGKYVPDEVSENAKYNINGDYFTSDYKYYQTVYVYTGYNYLKYDGIKLKDGRFIIRYMNRFYGSKAVAQIETGTLADYEETFSCFALCDLATGKFLTPEYNSMTTSDNGTTFTVYNKSGKKDRKYGYIDINGKELGWFDKAGDFYAGGKYAPVVKSGKLYLINKKMKRQSKTLKASGITTVVTLGPQLYGYVKDGKVYLFTM